MSEATTIWITRPQGQVDNLVSALEQQGAKAVQLPMLAIKPLPIDENIKAKVLDLDNYHLLFFISTNAATLGMELIEKYWPQFPVQLSIYSVGPTTAAVIEKYGQAVNYPLARMSSEALLDLDSLSAIQGKKALIVRGVGGRELLATALADRGAEVEYLELYQRVCPDYAAGTIAERYHQAPPAAVIVTSAEALDNFTDVLKRDNLSPDSLPLYVSSERIADKAQAAGFNNTITMSGADDKAIINSLAAIL